ncbi:MAG TPA: hypothetical protein VF175_09430 [Lacipirellula sp.]
MKFRFSLRALLVLVAVVAALGYWRHRPSQIARSFADALAAGDYRYANALVMNKDGVLAADGEVEAEFWARRLPQTASEWLAGRCRVEFIGKGTAFGRDGTAIATARGISEIDSARPLFPSTGSLQNR